MKVRFYCDIPKGGVRVHGTPYPWALNATSCASPGVIEGWVRVAFDVDLPPNLVLPPHDVVAPADVVGVVEEGGAA
jgi:hypothetical protein